MQDLETRDLETKKPLYTRKGFVIPAAIFALLVAFAAGGGGEEVADEPNEEVVTEEVEPEPEPEPDPEPVEEAAEDEMEAAEEAEGVDEVIEQAAEEGDLTPDDADYFFTMSELSTDLSELMYEGSMNAMDMATGAMSPQEYASSAERSITDVQRLRSDSEQLDVPSVAEDAQNHWHNALDAIEQGYELARRGALDNDAAPIEEGADLFDEGTRHLDQLTESLMEIDVP